jgi:hypothetical protein
MKQNSRNLIYQNRLNFDKIKVFLFLILLVLISNEVKAETCLPYNTSQPFNNAWWAWTDRDSYVNSAEVTITINNNIVYGTRGGAIATFSYGGMVYHRGATKIFTYPGNGKNGSGAYFAYPLCYDTPAAPAGPVFSYSTTQDQAAGCPADRPSGYILQRRSYEVWSDGSVRNFGGWYNVADYCSAVGLYTTTQDQAAACPADRPSGYILQRRSYEVWSDGSTRNFSAWYNAADYCSSVYSYTGYNYTTSACPATTPSGVINMRQSYEVWSDGSIRNYSGWVATSNTCAAVYQSTESRSQALACAAPYPEGGNGIGQTSSRQIWSDGPRAWSAWATVSNTCYKTVSDVKDNTRKTCAEGQTGYRITEWRRTHKEYSANSGKTPTEIAALNEQNATVWTEVEVANTCTNVPDKITKETGTRLLSCSSVYGGQASDYTGEVVETGTKVYTYSSVTKQTTTSFVSNVPPTYNSTCKSSRSDMATETSTKACPAGFSGTITSYRYVSTDAKGVKTYPNGTDFIESNNTCASTGASLDDSNNASVATKAKGLLANNTIKTSSLATKTDLDTFIKTLDKNTINTGENYKLHLIVDDLSTGKYNKANVVKTINAFKGVTGQDPIITVPQSLDKYIGNGGITAANYKNKVLESAVLNSSNQVKVTYSELTTGLKTGNESSFTVDLLK